MPRQIKRVKPLIYVFYEGESEQQYIDYLKNQFSDVAVIKRCAKRASTNLFEDTKSRFEKDKKYRDTAEATDEIWFFFDAELKDSSDEVWADRLKIINYLRRLRKKPNIRVRLLMTSGCIEYWFMLHFKDCAPPTQTEADKNNLVKDVKKFISIYKNGDKDSIWQIAPNYPTAVKYAKKRLQNISEIPCIEDTDERNQWLCKYCVTFSTVFEALDFLESLSSVA